MSLSKENISKLCMTGVYRCDPIASGLGKNESREYLYWACNWVFRVQKSSDNTYMMVDTYWSSGSKCFVLTDENFDKFEFLFDMNEVRRVSQEAFYDYNEDDRWFVAMDSGGWQFSKGYYVRKDAAKNNERLLSRLNEELASLKRQAEYVEREIARLKEKPEAYKEDCVGIIKGIQAGYRTEEGDESNE